MQPLLVSPLSRSPKLQPMQRANFATEPPANAIRLRTGHVQPVLQPNPEFVFYISNSTASVAVYSVTAAAEVIGIANAYVTQADEEQEVLEGSFARFARFTLEPEQPTDRDTVRRPVYRFPNR